MTGFGSFPRFRGGRSTSEEVDEGAWGDRVGDVLTEMEGAEVAEDIAEEGADAEFIEKSVLGNVQSDSVLILETRPFLTELLRSEE